MRSVEGKNKIPSRHVKFEEFTAVTIKNAIFWDKKPRSYLIGNTLHPHYGAQPVNAM
jgi:hypothetical protein